MAGLAAIEEGKEGGRRFTGAGKGFFMKENQFFLPDTLRFYEMHEVALY